MPFMMLYFSSQIGPSHHGFLVESRIRIACMFCVFYKKIDSGVFKCVILCSNTGNTVWMASARAIDSFMSHATDILGAHVSYHHFTRDAFKLRGGSVERNASPLDFSRRHTILSICWFVLMCSTRFFVLLRMFSFFLVFRLINQFVHFMLDKFAELMV